MCAVITIMCLCTIIMILHFCAMNIVTCLCAFIMITCLCAIGQFSEAGLHEWMPFVIFHARSRERSQHHFWANFWVGIVSRCVTMKVEPRIAKHYKCHHCSICKNYQGKGMEGGKKSVFASFFWLTRRSQVRGKICFGASYSMSNKLLLVARHILTTGLQKCP